MDRHPGAAVRAPQGLWEAEVAEGGNLVLRAPDGTLTALDQGVLPDLVFSPTGDRLAYERNGPETTLVLTSIPPDGQIHMLDDRPCAKDRPTFSEDGRRIAYVAGCTGIASIWVLELDAPRLGTTGSPTQVTNVGLENLPRTPGKPPTGFVPPPEGRSLRWTSTGLAWSAQGTTWESALP